jgi:hypothetical protein
MEVKGWMFACHHEGTNHTSQHRSAAKTFSGPATPPNLYCGNFITIQGEDSNGGAMEFHFHMGHSVSGLHFTRDNLRTNIVPTEF